MSSEVEIIRCWLKGLFKTIENAEDVEVKDFNFGPLEEKSKPRLTQKGCTYKSLVSFNRFFKNSNNPPWFRLYCDKCLYP